MFCGGFCFYPILSRVIYFRSLFHLQYTVFQKFGSNSYIDGLLNIKESGRHSTSCHGTWRVPGQTTESAYMYHSGMNERSDLHIQGFRISGVAMGEKGQEGAIAPQSSPRPFWRKY